VVSAFRSAFDEDENAGLTLLVGGTEDGQEETERLRLAAAMDDRITLVEDPDDGERETWLDAADCVVSLHDGDEPADDLTMFTLAGPASRGIPIIATNTGATSELLAEGAILLPTGPHSGEPDHASTVDAFRLVGDDPDAAMLLGQRGRTALLRSHAIALSGVQLRSRVEHSYYSWRARKTVDLGETQRDPLRPLRSARHVLLREPDVGGSHKIPMAPALRKAVLRVLNHYDEHVRTTLGVLVDGVERTVEELARRQDAISAAAGTVSLDTLVDQVDRLGERLDKSTDRVTSLDDNVLRARADLAAAGTRLGELEDAVIGEATKRTRQVETLADRLDRLTAALDKTLDRIDGLEQRTLQSLQNGDTRTEDGLRVAQYALRTSDALRRVVLREHECRVDSATLPDTPSSLVLCDAGLLRLPAEDGVMLPLLSSNGVWEPELSALIDSLVEPGKIFVDVGAYVGYHTLRVLSRLGTSGAVLAVEPSVPAATLLRHNMSVNVSAAWDTPGHLAAEPAMTGGVSVRPVTEPPPDPESAEPAVPAPPTVPSVRLDREIDELEALRGMPLSVVKVDAPGSGHRALGGLVRRLRRDRPHVFCAFSVAQTSEVGDDPATVLREFDTWGFDIVLLGEQDPVTPQQVLERTAGQRSTTLWLRPRGR
jgi:FkbM family methyltransferase